ncbi:MAG: acyl-CoA dehydrogenase family protein [Thermoplasmatota archaeon]
MRAPKMECAAMAFTLTEDETAIQRVVREFARDRIGLEAAALADRHDRFPADAIAAAAELGLTGILAPDGGLGGTTFALAIDELAQVDPNVAAALVVHNAAFAMLAALPAGPRREQLASSLAAGELAAFLVAEEATGSDAAQTGTFATPTPDGYRITGQKVWAVNAAAARHLFVLARVPDKGLTMFVLPADAAGVSLGEDESLLGLRAAGIRTVYLSGVQVPADAMVGAAGQGETAMQAGRRWIQVGAAAALCGCVAGALSAAARFAEDRVQFNQPIGLFQAVSDGITRIDVELAAARSLVLAAAAQAGADGSVWAARAKAFAAGMAIPMTRQAIRLQGGTGFMRHGGSERFARDARALQFLGEPTAVQKDEIKRSVLDLPFPPAP